MLSASREKSSRRLDHHVSQFPPIFIILVDGETNILILEYVPDAAQAKRFYSLGLLVDYAIDGSGAQGETDWNYERSPFSCGCGKVSDSRFGQQLQRPA